MDGRVDRAGSPPLFLFTTRAVGDESTWSSDPPITTSLSFAVRSEAVPMGIVLLRPLPGAFAGLSSTTSSPRETDRSRLGVVPLGSIPSIRSSDSAG
jgi:hypothetical protein